MLSSCCTNLTLADVCRWQHSYRTDGLQLRGGYSQFGRSMGMRNIRGAIALISAAGLLTGCDLLSLLDPRVAALCRAHSGNVLVFEWHGARWLLPIEAGASREQDAEWRIRLGLPPPSVDPLLRLSHPIRAAAPFGTGWLVGTNFGEWDGGLFFIRQGHPPQELVSENVHALVPTTREIYALFGLAHMGTDEGHYRLISLSGNGPIVGEGQPLPGSPIDIAEDRGVTFVAGGHRNHGERTWARAFGTGEPSSVAVLSPCR